MKRLISSLIALAILLSVSAPASAQRANVKVLKPLQLTALRNLVFGDILLGTISGTATVQVTPAGRTCGSGLTCSGLFNTASFRVNGSNGQVISIFSATPTVTMTSASGATLTLTPSMPASVTMPNSGNPGITFEVGGSFPITSTTREGVYTGTIDIQVAYQ